MSSVARRVLALLIVTGAVVSGLAIDHNSAPSPTTPDTELAGAGASKDALSSAWYCPLTFSRRTDPAAGSLAVTNTGDKPVSAVASVFPVGQPSVDAPLNVAAHSRVIFNPGTVADAEFASVLMRVEGGGVAVEHGVRDANGESWAPCAVEGSSTWYTADGSTDAADVKLALFNPFADEAIVDISATTDAGRAEPAEFRGVVVSARSLKVIDLGDQLRRRQWISTTVDARRGRLVVSQLQNGTVRNVPGISLTMAVPSLEKQITLPTGVVTAGTTDRVTIYNPTDAEANVVIQVIPENGAKAIELPTVIAAKSRYARDLETEVSVPKNMRTSVSVLSAKDFGVVASRTFTAVKPSDFIGYSISHGSPISALHWAFGAADTTDPKDNWAWVLNNGTDPTEVRVSLVADGNVTQVAKLRVEPAKPAPLHIDAITNSAGKAIVFDSDAPVVVTREIRKVPGAMLTGAPAVALR